MASERIKKAAGTFLDLTRRIRRRPISRICEILQLLSRPYGAIVREFQLPCYILGCTISSLSRRIDELRGLNVTTILIEEAAKILETEMLPVLLLHPQRFIMIGDPGQLAPVVACETVQLLGRFTTSLFQRIQRLGAGSILLNKQGRARREIADLYRNRYPERIEDLKSVSKLPEIPMIDRPVQWVDVVCNEESRPMTNPVEAEFVVEFLRRAQLTQKLNLSAISVITPYAAQKNFLSEVIERAHVMPRDVCTVDEFQGLQNLVILVSLVSRSPSLWLRDHRRITVLVSRARCALIIFGNKAGFMAVPEWKPVIDAIHLSNENRGLLYDKKRFSRITDFRRENDALVEKK
jgi:superfamily I DNA and/or RNA helicase